jgi:hypothetical protein
MSNVEVKNPSKFYGSLFWFEKFHTRRKRAARNHKIKEKKEEEEKSAHSKQAGESGFHSCHEIERHFEVYAPDLDIFKTERIELLFI